MSPELQLYFKARLSYNPTTGKLTWKHHSDVRKPLTFAGTLDADGYVKVRVDGYEYKAASLIWLIVTGSWPKGVVDHINRIRADNSWENLRDVSQSLNQLNWDKQAVVQTGKFRWRGTVNFEGKQYIVGVFDSEEEAREACRTKQQEFLARFALVGTSLVALKSAQD